jgi:mRNA-degrading endonuclease RelE of RelBE toxin-antitoxin system
MARVVDRLAGGAGFGRVNGRVGHLLRDEYAGQHSARRRPDWRVRYRIEQDSHTVVVLDVSHRSGAYGA